MIVEINITFCFSIGPGIFILAASYAGCDRGLVVVLFIFVMGSMGPFYSGVQVNTLDLSPNYSGTLMAVGNTLNAITGMVAPFVVGLMTPEVYLEIERERVNDLNIFFLPSENVGPVANGLLGHLHSVRPLHHCLLHLGLS